MDDTQLAQAVAAVPHHGILLVEDIDCAFPSREDEEEDSLFALPPPPGRVRRGGRKFYPSAPPRGSWGARSNITMSGLLNVLDGVGSGTSVSSVV